MPYSDTHISERNIMDNTNIPLKTPGYYVSEDTMKTLVTYANIGVVAVASVSLVAGYKLGRRLGNRITLKFERRTR
jgi:membrane protein DedA with SNARE-associated domain